MALRYIYTLAICLLMIILGLSAQSAQAETRTRSQDSAVVYAPDFFESYSPDTALDMVSRIPGFNLSGSSGPGQRGGERGFGQADSNVLINGQRPSTKSSGAFETLSRILAKSVIRIEILDGASLNIPGLSGQVANIVYKAGALSGTWRYAMRFEKGTQPQLGEGYVSISGEHENQSLGSLSYSASLNADEFKRTTQGTERHYDGRGSLIEEREESVTRDAQLPKLDVSLTLKRPNDHIANLNLTGNLINFQSQNRESFRAAQHGGTDGVDQQEGQNGQSQFLSGEDEFNYEIGGDYALPFDPKILPNGTLKFIGLHRFEDSQFGNIFRLYPDGDDAYISTNKRRDKEGEYIARTEYNWTRNAGVGPTGLGGAMDWQISLEGAFNCLDSAQDFSSTSSAPSTSHVRVEERRSEINLTNGWALSDSFNLQTSIGAEYSELDVVSLDAPARTFFRPKGFISASYDVSPLYRLVGKVERKVGQLNFGTFVSTVNLSENINSSGNAQIVPTQQWEGGLSIERKTGQSLTGTMTGFVHLIQDPIDRIRFPDGSEGAGNLDSALLYGLKLDGLWKLDTFGIEGMELDFGLGLRGSQIDDPVTGERRPINRTVFSNYNIELRRDIPNSAWRYSAGIRKQNRHPFYRLDQIFERRENTPLTYISLTNTALFGIKTTIFYENLLNTTTQRTRRIYDGDRNDDILQTQISNHKRGQRFSLKISDTF